MPKAFATWTVLPHDPIKRLADNLWVVQGDLPGMPLRRWMTVVRLGDGELLLHNAAALAADAMRTLDEWGRSSTIVVPSAWHRLDSANFKNRYPAARVLCPAAARAKVEQVVQVDGSYDDFEATAGVTLQHLDGLRQQEGVLRVESDDGVTLVFNDIFFNQKRLPGFTGLVMSLLGSAGEPGPTRIGRWFIMKDKAAFRAHLHRLARDPRLIRIVPGHGGLIEHDAGEVLEAAAARLA